MPPSVQERDRQECLIKTDPHELSGQGPGSGGGTGGGAGGGGGGGGGGSGGTKGKGMTNLLRIAAVAEIEGGWAAVCEVVVVRFLILIR